MLRKPLKPCKPKQFKKVVIIILEIIPNQMKMVPFDMQCYLIDCAFKRKVEVSEKCDDKMRYAL